MFLYEMTGDNDMHEYETMRALTVSFKAFILL